MLSAALSLSPVAAGATPASPATASTPARPATATTAVSTTVDFSGDGHADLIARTPTGVLYLYRGNGAGGFLGPRTVLGTGWQIYDHIFSPGDFSGDGHADLIARTPTGLLYLYRGNGAGGFLGPRTVLGTGWQIYDRLFSPGDFTGDRHPDLLARVKGGALYLYKGNGAGGFLGSRTLIGTGWNMFDKVFGVGDFSGDGKVDLMGRTPTGYLYLYRGNGAGGFLSRTVIGTGWTVFNLVGGVG
ncbi:FG-GAP repeat domain-containing protein [Oryzihumus sp.]